MTVSLMRKRLLAGERCSAADVPPECPPWEECIADIGASSREQAVSGLGCGMGGRLVVPPTPVLYSIGTLGVGNGGRKAQRCSTPHIRGLVSNIRGSGSTTPGENSPASGHHAPRVSSPRHAGPPPAGTAWRPVPRVADGRRPPPSAGPVVRPAPAPTSRTPRAWRRG